MRHKSAQLSRPVSEIKIPRPDGELNFKVAAIPLGLARQFEKVVPKPAPPTSSVMRVGHAPDITRNWEDPEFLKSMEEFIFLRSLYMVYRSLELDENLEWPCKPVDIVTMRTLAQSIVDSGLSDGDVSMILDRANHLSNIMPEDLEAARKRFL